MDSHAGRSALANVRRVAALEHGLLDLGGAPVSPVLVVIAPEVPVIALASALAQAGLTIRHERGSARLVIRPAGSVRTVAPELARLLNRLSLGDGSARGARD